MPTARAVNQALSNVARGTVRGSPLPRATQTRVINRNARHQRRLAAHRQRVQAKKAREARVARKGTVFGQAPGRIQPGRKAIQRAVKAERRAADKLPQSRVYPKFPTLAHYTPHQRQLIISAYARAGRTHPLHAQDRAHGLNPTNALDRETRRQLRQVYGRAVREQNVRREARYVRQYTAAQPRQRPHVGDMVGAAGRPRSFLQSIRDVYPDKPPKRPTDRQLAIYYRQHLNPTRDDQLKAGHRKAHEGGFGGLPLATILNGGIHPVSGMTLSRAGHAFGQLAGPVAKDSLQLIANTPASLYNVAAATYEAATGDTHRFKQLWKEYKNNDAIALALQGRGKEAVKALSQHPVSTALEVVGAKAAVGRGLGRVERLAGHNPVRADAVLEGTNIRVRRPFSRDAITRQRQMFNDARRTRKAAQFHRQADKLEAVGNYRKAAELRHKARQASPTHVSDREIQRRVDERNAANEDVRRQLRTKAIKTARKHHVPAKKGGHLVSLVAQNIVKAEPKDVRAYIAELDRQHASGHLSRAQEIANRDLTHELRKAVDSKATDWPAIEKAARGFQHDMAPIEKQLIDRGLLDASQAERSRLIPYAVRNMGAKHDGERIVAADGTQLTNDAIRAHMNARHGGQAPEPAFLSQSPNARGARNFFMSAIQRNTIPNATRTGEATRLGTFDAHPDVLVEQAARAHGLIASDHGYKGMIDEFAIRHPETGKVVQFKTKREVDKFVREMQTRGSRNLRAVRANPFLGKQKELQSVMDEANAGATSHGGIADAVHEPLVRAMQSAIHGEDGKGPWVVMHDVAADRFNTHLKQLGPGAGLKGLRRINQAFRNTVLPLSVKWVTGNVVEAAVRTTLARAGPLSYITGRKMFNRLDELQNTPGFDEAKALEAQVRTKGGGQFSMAERTTVKAANDFNNTSLKPLANALGAAAKAPGPKQVGDLFGRYTHAVFHVNSVLERQFQVALAGKYAREFMVTPGERMTMQRAVEQGARGLMNTNDQVAMGRFIDRAYGKYGKFNPTERALISYYTPFIAWSLNAVKFVTQVLPKDHPIVTGLIAASSQASLQWEQDHGLNMWASNAAPGWLQGSIPVGGGKIRAARYTPFGFFSDPAQSVASTVMPQFMGAIFALNGLDWKGESLAGPAGGEVSQGKKFGTAFEAFFGSTIPIVSQIQQVASKKGPLGLKLRRQFWPFEPVKNTPGSGSGGPVDEIQRSLQPDLKGQELDNELQKALAP